MDFSLIYMYMATCPPTKSTKVEHGIQVLCKIDIIITDSYHPLGMCILKGGEDIQRLDCLLLW